MSNIMPSTFVVTSENATAVLAAAKNFGNYTPTVHDVKSGDLYIDGDDHRTAIFYVVRRVFPIVNPGRPDRVLTVAVYEGDEFLGEFARWANELRCL